MIPRNRTVARRVFHRCLVPFVAALMAAGCSSQHAYDTAFSSTTALADNSHTYQAPANQVLNALKLSLVQQGFEIAQVSAADGLVKGIRTFDDPKDPKIAYLVSLTADVIASSSSATVVTAAASQKTVLNREIHKYYHLLGLLPIPTGREYQSVLRAEGNITGAGFYQDLFAAVSRNLVALRNGSPTPAGPSKAAALGSGIRSHPTQAPATSANRSH